MGNTPEKPELQAALERARARWLNAAAVNAGGRYAVLPALGASVIACSLALFSQPSVVLLATLSVVALLGVVATLALTRKSFSRPRKPGAPDWSLPLDRALKLDDALVTLLDGAGPFAKALQARVVAGFDETKARSAAPRRHYGALAVALLLALLPLSLWQPTADRGTELAQEAANLPGLDNRTTHTGQGAATGGESKGGQPDKRQRKAAGEMEGDGEGGEGEVASQPRPGADGRKSDRPGEKPPAIVNPQPSDSQGAPPKAGDVKADAPPASEDPRAKVDAKDVPVTPDAGEGERRAEERRKWVYNPDGKPADGAEAANPKWREKAEDVIPRMKLTSRERKVLEDWFRKIGTR